MRIGITTSIATAIAIGVLIASGGGGGGLPPGQANFWIDTTGGTCVRHASPLEYANDGTECVSMNAAYAASSCGDVSKVVDGTYGDQVIIETAGGSACVGNPIVIQAATGVRPDAPSIDFGNNPSDYASNSPDNLTLSGFDTAEGININGDATNIVIDDMDGGTFDVAGGAGGTPTNITIQNSDWGPCSSSGTGDSCSAFYSHSFTSQNQPRVWSSTNVILDGNVFHDIVRDQSGDHFECNWIGEGISNMTYRNNTYYNCSQYAIALPGQMGGSLWLFENNMFGPAPDESMRGLKFGLTGNPTANIVVRYNTFGPGQSLALNEEPGGCNNQCWVYGNIISVSYFFETFTCMPEAIYDYNIFLDDFTIVGGDGPKSLDGGTACGTHATIVSAPSGNYLNFGFVDPSLNVPNNLHLTGSNWSADNYVPNGTDPAGIGELAFDVDGHTRPIGAARDAGADER